MYWKPSVNYVIRLLLVNPGDVLQIQCMLLIYDSFFSGSTVCGQQCIYYLIHRYRGYSMTNITGSLKNPKEATDIVKTFEYINKA
jgi:hypothetical protein